MLDKLKGLTSGAVSAVKSNSKSQDQYVVALDIGTENVKALIGRVAFWAVKVLPGESTWQGYAGDAAYLAILGSMSSGGIVIASLAGYWSGEFSNSFTLAKMKILTQGKWLWMRTIGSTLIGELVDSVAFVAIAILFKVFPAELFWTLIVTNYIFKCLIEAVMTPVTYAVVTFLKRTENEDYYDKDTNFTPFTI